MRSEDNRCSHRRSVRMLVVLLRVPSNQVEMHGLLQTTPGWHPRLVVPGETGSCKHEVLRGHGRREPSLLHPDDGDDGSPDILAIDVHPMLLCWLDHRAELDRILES